MSTPAQRFVAIMEALSNVSQVGSTANEIVQRANLTSSTGYRMLAELEELGLVHRIGDRKLVANFNFERQVRHPGLDPKELAYLCKKISLELTSSSEIVVQSGQNLFWHIVQQHEDQAIRPRAYPGFTQLHNSSLPLEILAPWGPPVGLFVPPHLHRFDLVR